MPAAVNTTLRMIADYAEFRENTWRQQLAGRPPPETFLSEISGPDQADAVLGRSLFNIAMEQWPQLRRVVEIASSRHVLPPIALPPCGLVSTTRRTPLCLQCAAKTRKRLCPLPSSLFFYFIDGRSMSNRTRSVFPPLFPFCSSFFRLCRAVADVQAKLNEAQRELQDRRQEEERLRKQVQDLQEQIHRLQTQQQQQQQQQQQPTQQAAEALVSISSSRGLSQLTVHSCTLADHGTAALCDLAAVSLQWTSYSCTRRRRAAVAAGPDEATFNEGQKRHFSQFQQC